MTTLGRPAIWITHWNLPSSDNEIRLFRQELKSCTEGSFTGSDDEHYTDSGGKSGGQKEKLAYQFGLEFGETRSRSFRFVVIDEAFGRGSDESAAYGLRLFRELNLQLLIITPLQKIHVIEPFVSTVGFVHNQDGRESLLRCLTIEEYREELQARALDATP